MTLVGDFAVVRWAKWSEKGCPNCVPASHGLTVCKHQRDQPLAWGWRSPSGPTLLPACGGPGRRQPALMMPGCPAPLPWPSREALLSPPREKELAQVRGRVSPQAPQGRGRLSVLCLSPLPAGLRSFCLLPPDASLSWVGSWRREARPLGAARWGWAGSVGAGALLCPQPASLGGLRCL